jgi:hypothetical protein
MNVVREERRIVGLMQFHPHCRPTPNIQWDSLIRRRRMLLLYSHLFLLLSQLRSHKITTIVH